MKNFLIALGMLVMLGVLCVIAYIITSIPYWLLLGYVIYLIDQHVNEKRLKKFKTKVRTLIYEDKTRDN